MKKYFTLQIFSSDGKTAITKRVSKSIIVFLTTISIIVLLGIITLVVFYGKVYVKALKVRNLEERNRFLEGEFKKISQIEKDIEEISVTRKKLEVVFGIKKMESDMQTEEPMIDNINEPLKEIKDGDTLVKSPEMKIYLEKSKILNRGMPNLIPVNGWITKGFDRVHRGVDIAAVKGTAIFSAMDGIVENVGWDSILGNVIRITNSQGYTTIYGHCSNIYVEKGGLVRKGGIIASIGKTGRTDAPHLHYEILINGTNVNPELFFVKGYR